MNRVIYKYEVPTIFNLPGLSSDSPLVTEVALPLGAEVLRVGEQGQYLVCWARVDPDQASFKTQRFVLLATGAELTEKASQWLDESFVYHGTAQFNGGSFILHIYKEKPHA